MKSIKWWNNAIIYQIYPRSFMDANNDGTGDLQGIIQKLDYLKSIYVDAIWISPIYESPMEDNGYDVSDYFKISPLFGTMQDMDDLIKEAHKRGIKIILDLVCNHTSKDHMWFQEAIKSKDNYYHDFYYFSDTCDDKKSSFGGSAWEYVPSLNQYYYHYFAKGQVDLNWGNQKVRDEIAKMVNFWLDKGVAGFRLDAIELIGKELENNIFSNGPKIHDYLRELNEKTFGRFEDSITVGEGWPTPQIAIDYTKEENKELNMMFQFESVSLDWGAYPLGKYAPKELDFRALKEVFSKWQKALKDEGWNALFLENHDLSRIVSRYGDDKKYWAESAKALAAMQFLQQGTPFIYQGQEIGMTNAYFKNLEDYQDIEVYMQYEEVVNCKKVVTKEEFLHGAALGSRDNSRTPMQWSMELNAGFNHGMKPWIGINPNYKKINVDAQEKDPNSILNFYREIFKIRKERYQELILFGDYESYLDEHPTVYAYSRSYKDQELLVLINFSKQTKSVKLTKTTTAILLSNYKDSQLDISDINLRPYETIIYEVKRK